MKFSCCLPSSKRPHRLTTIPPFSLNAPININTEYILEKLEGGERCASAIIKAIKDPNRSPVADAILRYGESLTIGSNLKEYRESCQSALDHLVDTIVKEAGILRNRINFSDSPSPVISFLHMLTLS
jgi:hypothetical protein